MSKRNAPAENLKIWHAAAAENRELRLLQITALAKELGSSDEGEREALRILPPTLPCEPPIAPADGFARAMALDEQMALCRALPKSKDAQNELPAPPAAPRVARLAGAVFDKAFRLFSPLLGMGRPVYLSSLDELLEELAAGNADFALLPIEDAKGARFLRFYEDFDRLELHITHTCSVPSEESDRSVRFALLSRLYTPKKPIAGRLLLEYRVSGQDQGAMQELLTAAAEAGLTLYRTDALPDPFFEEGFIHHVILAANEQSDEDLLNTYLGIALPRVTAVGRYIHLKEGNDQ